MLDLIADEQNGFLAQRSRSDHILIVTSLIRKPLSQGKSIFAAMIGLEKCFDWIKRPLLYYRLLEMNIDGKIYKAIQSFIHK